MSHRRRTVEPFEVEDVAGRLRRALAQPGPHDERIGAHRTYDANRDPNRRGLAVAGTGARGRFAGRERDARLVARRLDRPGPVAAYTGVRQVARRWWDVLRWMAVP